MIDSGNIFKYFDMCIACFSIIKYKYAKYQRMLYSLTSISFILLGKMIRQVSKPCMAYLGRKTIIKLYLIISILYFKSGCQIVGRKL